MSNKHTLFFTPDEEVVLRHGGKVKVSLHDEFIAFVDGVELGVIVYRNGDASNRWMDGTACVDEDVRLLAALAEEVLTTDGNAVADCYINVSVDADGVASL